METSNPLVLTPINGEPRIRDIDLAIRLGFERPLDIRELIKRHSKKLSEFSVLRTIRKTSGEQGGRPSVEYYLDRQQSLFICMKSETDNAFEVQVDVIRVYDAYLSGTLTHTTKPVELSRMQLIELALSAEKERLALEQHVEIIQPKADAFDRIATSTGGALNLTNAAKSLQLRPHEFNQHLHLMRWIYKRAGGRSWIAYQDRLQEGVLEHKIYTYVAPDGTENIREQVLVTAQGLALLAKTLNPLATARRSNEQGGGRILARAKSNIGPDTGGFGYELAICEVAPGIETTRILWGNALEGSARDLLAAAEYQSDPNERNTTTEAMDWLREQLSHGAVKVADVQREARAAGISDKALRTARERLGIKSSRAAFQGGYQWAMPPLDERT